MRQTRQSWQKQQVEEPPSDGPDNSNDTEESNSSPSSPEHSQADHPVTSPDRKESPFSPLPMRFLFELIVQHMLKKIPYSTRSSRLEYLLLQFKEDVALKEIIHKFDKKDLAVIAEHKKFIEILHSSLYRLIHKKEHSSFQDIDHQKIVLNAYGMMQLDINLKLLRSALLRDPSFKKKQAQKVSQLLDELIAQTKADIESNNIKIATEEDQLVINQIQGRFLEISPQADPFADFSMNRDNQYDEVSKYGIFSSKKEEMEVNRDGVFNYRLHRTMQAIEKARLMVPQENIANAKKLALFLIRLTDLHVNGLIEGCMKIAEVTSRPINDRPTFDEVSYFSASNPRETSTTKDNSTISLPSLQQYDQFSLFRLYYQPPMKQYQNLRKMQFLEQQNLHGNISAQLMLHFSHGKRRLNKEEKIVAEYFTKKPNAMDCLAKLQEDTEKQRPNRQNSTLTRVQIQMRHIKHWLEQHPFYRNHQLLWRFSAVY